MKQAIRYSLYALGISAVWIFFEHIMGWNTSRHDIGQYTRNATIFLFWIFIAVAIWQRRSEQNNTLTFKEGFETGLFTSLIYCLGFTLLIIFYQQFVNPEFYQTFRDFKLHELQTMNASQEQIDAAMKEVEMSYGGTLTSYGLLFFFSSIFGIGISAIAAAILKRK